MSILASLIPSIFSSFSATYLSRIGCSCAGCSCVGGNCVVVLFVLWLVVVVIVGVLFFVLAAIVGCGVAEAAGRRSRTQQAELRRSDPVVLERAMSTRAVRPRIRVTECPSGYNKPSRGHAHR